MAFRSEQIKRKKRGAVSKEINSSDTEEDLDEFFLISFVGDNSRVAKEFAIIKANEVTLIVGEPDRGLYKYRLKKYDVEILKRGNFNKVKATFCILIKISQL